MTAYTGLTPSPMTGLALVGLLLALAGCMANPAVTVEPADSPAPVVAPITPQPTRNPAAHTVVRGDNLYRIALEYGLDFRTLAALNGISEPYTIHPGDRLLLRAPTSAPAPSPAPRPAPPSPAIRPVPTAPDTATIPAARPAPTPVAPPPALPPPTPAALPPPAPAATAALPAAPRSSGRWGPPVDGRAVRDYSDAHGGNKGVDVEASRGAPVWAAADGTVVYAGDGLKQYGNLIIVKHDEEYLSAYGHLDRALVAEGTRVRKGQAIASVGGPGSQGLLHFEIRRRGEPVNPEALVGRLAR